MKCPFCNKTQRITEKEKRETMEKGSLETSCYYCGSVITLHKYDVDHNERRKHNLEIGICTSCNNRPAEAGYATCKECRAYFASERQKTKSLGIWDDEFVKPKKKKKEELDDVSKKAHEAGVSYGVYVAMMEGRKKHKKDLD